MTSFVIKGAYVLTMDEKLGDLEQGDVLVENGVIVAVKRDIATDSADVIDGSGMIIMPGLIDTHTHLWQTPVRGVGVDCWGDEYFRTIHPVSQYVSVEDLRAGTYAGALDLMANGVTTAFDFCHSIHTPEHADSAIGALDSSGIRAIYGYSMRDRPELESRTLRSTADRMQDARRVRNSQLLEGSRVSLAVAMNNIDHVSDEQNEAEIRLARELDVQVTVHSILPGHIADLHGRKLLGPDIQWVHATAASDFELAMLSDDGGTISVTPESEAMTMGQWPITGRALRAGVPVGLGIDLPSALNSSVVNQARAAVALDRLGLAHSRRVQGHPPARDGFEQPLDARRALELVTREAAESIGLGSVTGSITPGKAADLLMLSIPPFMKPAGDIAAHVAIHSSRADVQSVFIDGVPRVSGGKLVGVDLERVGYDLENARQRMSSAL